MGIQDQHVKSENDPDESEFDGDNIQLNVDQKSYGKTITDDRENVPKNCEQKNQKGTIILRKNGKHKEKALRNLNNQVELAVMTLTDK